MILDVQKMLNFNTNRQVKIRPSLTGSVDQNQLMRNTQIFCRRSPLCQEISRQERDTFEIAVLVCPFYNQNKPFSVKRRLDASHWSIIPSNTSPNYGSINSSLSNNRPTHELELSFDMRKSKVAKCFGPFQPAQSAQAGMSRCFSQVRDLNIY